jgi:hypothetical protein
MKLMPLNSSVLYTNTQPGSTKRNLLSCRMMKELAAMQDDECQEELD